MSTLLAAPARLKVVFFTPKHLMFQRTHNDRAVARGLMTGDSWCGDSEMAEQLGAPIWAEGQQVQPEQVAPSYQGRPRGSNEVPQGLAHDALVTPVAGRSDHLTLEVTSTPPPPSLSSPQRSGVCSCVAPPVECMEHTRAGHERFTEALPRAALMRTSPSGRGPVRITQSGPASSRFAFGKLWSMVVEFRRRRAEYAQEERP